MNEKLKWRSQAVVPEHAEAKASAEERANVAAFDDAVKALGAGSSEARPRRWITRIGTLLRQVRTQRDVGQELIAEKAQVTQPYLSRLENGGLSKHGPTIDVLFRCAEAMGCDIEVAMRSKVNGELLGSVSSADLGRTGLELSKSPSEPAVEWTGDGVVNLVFKRGTARHKAVVWEATQTADGRVLFNKTSPDETASSVASVVKRYLGRRARSHGSLVTKITVGTAAPQTVKVGEGDVVVIRGAT
jgi:transcriptional regulator with XRE-family HTH domain